ncbi:MAG TPA: MFS transporter [Dehalococcoidia bacterium]|nr:MFS transporter [Dehalococcoidia bacterium]
MLIATVAIANMLTPLNSTILAVALPEIRGAFGVSHAEIAWIVSAYLIAMVVAQPLGGRIGDQLGHARTLRLSMLAFGGFSVAAAVAPSFPLLVAFRAGQALAGGALAPVGIAMLRTSVEPSMLGRSAGITSSVLGLSAALGPLVGAALLGIGSWRWLFLVNLPIVVAGLVCLSLLKFSSDQARGKLNLDFVGSLSLAAVFAAATNLLGTGLGSGSVAIMAGVVGLIAAAAVFWWSQAKGRFSVAEWALFRSRSFSASTLYVMGSYMVHYTLFISIPFFVKEVHGGSDGTVGLAIFAMTMTMAVSAPIAGQFADRFGRRVPALFGGLLQVVACLSLIAAVSFDQWLAFLTCALILIGASVGVGMNVATVAAVESAPREKAGSAAGTTSLLRYAGSIIGAGLLGLILSTDATAPSTDVFRLLFAILLVTACLVTFLSLSIHRFAESEGSPTESLTAAT